MKKMLLILVSGLLLLCMAGSAMALPYDAAIWNAAGTSAAPNPIALNPGNSITLSYRGDNIDSAAFNVGLKYVVTVTSQNSLGSPSDVTYTLVHPNFTPTGSTYIDKGVITLTLNPAANKDAKYLVSIKAGDETTDVEFGGASRTVTSVPEFPTVALPVAGMIGLLFVFGRKKEGL